MNRYYPAGVIFHNTILGLPSGEEACLAWDRGPPRDVKALGLIILEEGEASGVTSRSSPSTKSSESWTWGAWRRSSCSRTSFRWTTWADENL